MKAVLPKKGILVKFESLLFVKGLSISLPAQEGSSVITKHGAVKKRTRISFKIEATQAKRNQSTLKAIFKFVLTQMT